MGVVPSRRHPRRHRWGVVLLALLGYGVVGEAHAEPDVHSGVVTAGAGSHEPVPVAHLASAASPSTGAAVPDGSQPGVEPEVLRGEQGPDEGLLPATSFFGVPDASVRDALATDRVVRVRKGRGGRSLGFKLTLASGIQGYYKPSQTFSAANWRAEVAAYHLDRLLGLGRIPAVVSRAIPWSRLERAAGDDRRRAEIRKRRDGAVEGAFIWWIPGGLDNWADYPGWERWVRVTSWNDARITPYQRPREWKRQVDRRRARRGRWRAPASDDEATAGHGGPDTAERPGELSDLILFDYLTRNLDRWGGGNANVLVRRTSRALVFLDNGAGFYRGSARPPLLEERLQTLQRFRRSTVAAIKAFQVEDLEERLAEEPLGTILRGWQLDGLRSRRRALLEWVALMERKHGSAIYDLSWQGRGELPPGETARGDGTPTPAQRRTATSTPRATSGPAS